MIYCKVGLRKSSSPRPRIAKSRCRWLKSYTNYDEWLLNLALYVVITPPFTNTAFLSFLRWNVGTFFDWRISNEWSLFSQKNTWWLAQKGMDRKKHGDDNESPVVLLRIYTRSATRRQTVMVDINLLLSHFPRFLVCFATMAAELWRIGPNPDISLTSNIPSLSYLKQQSW